MDAIATRQGRSERRKRLKAELDRVIAEALDEQRIVGTVVEVLVDGEPAYQCAAGFADREADRPMTEDSIFLLSSVAKPIATVAALSLVSTMPCRNGCPRSGRGYRTEAYLRSPSVNS